MEEGTLFDSKPKAPGSFNVAELEAPARFLNLDPDLWVFRRFGKLHLLNILHLQQHLAKLEYQLEREKSNQVPRNLEKLMRKIKRAVAEYDTALSAQAAFKSYQVPDQHTIKQLKEIAERNGKENYQPLRVGLDIRPGMRRKDLASIAAADKTWTHRFIDRHDFLRKRFADEKVPELPILLYSEESVRFAEGCFIRACFCILLVGPIVSMSYLHSKMWKLVLIVGFLFVASVISGGFLSAPNRSGLALVAGYAGILVVFLSNTSS